MKLFKYLFISSLFGFMILMNIHSEAASPNAPFNLRSFDKYNPIGTDNAPYFG